MAATRVIRVVQLQNTANPYDALVLGTVHHKGSTEELNHFEVHGSVLQKILGVEINPIRVGDEIEVTVAKVHV